MGLAGRLLVGGCMCYQAVALILIAMVFIYFGLIGPTQFLTEFQENYRLLVTVAIPTTIGSIIVFLFCYYVDVNF